MTQTVNSLVNLNDFAKKLPKAWSSTVLLKLGNVNFKVLRMDEGEYGDESHPYTEVFLVLDGLLRLVIDQQVISVKSGETYTVPPNTPHAVAKGSFGILIIFDPIED